jgi:hypothetical protein
MVQKNPNNLKATYQSYGNYVRLFVLILGAKNKAKGGKEEKGVIGSFSHRSCLSPKKKS